MRLDHSLWPALGRALFVFHMLLPSAHGWEQHALFQADALAPLRGPLERTPLPAPSPKPTGQPTWERLQIRRAAVPAFPAAKSAWDLLTQTGGFSGTAQVTPVGTVDEPDQGMDQDLSEALLSRIDPQGDRSWMGGSKGPYSQGFRHMLFLGFRWANPLASFQIPLRKLGQADHRAAVFWNEAVRLARDGQTAWAWRLLSWSLHFVQDLAQPFHSTQIPHPGLISWRELFRLDLPVAQLGRNFVAATTQSLGKAHTDFEKRIQAQWISGSIRQTCATQFRSEIDPHWNRLETPEAIAQHAAQASRHLAWSIGNAIRQAGKHAGQDSAPDSQDSQDAMPEVCQALRIGFDASRRMVEIFLTATAL